MIYKYILFAIRNLVKHRIASFLNILGISLGLTCSIFILYYVNTELSYDKGYADYERIYRINMGGTSNSDRAWAVVSPTHAQKMATFFPEIESITRLFKIDPITFEYMDKNEQINRFEEKQGFYVDTSFNNVFGLKFIKGNPLRAFNEEYNIVLTQSMAERYFGNNDPIDKIISITGRESKFRVTGVVEDINFNSHIEFDYLISFSTLYDVAEQNGFTSWLESSWWAHFYTYFKLKPNVDISQMEQKLEDFTFKFYRSDNDTREDIISSRAHKLQAIKDIHLTSHLEQEIGINGNRNYVITFIIVALLILVIVSVNFINLTTSVAFQRMREVGIRKVVGAHKSQLSLQFLFEPLLITLISFFSSLLFVELLRPFFEIITGFEFSILTMFTPLFLAFSVLIIVFFGIIVGIYPVRILARFSPIFAMKSSYLPQTNIGTLRKGLVVLQFVISIFVVFSTIVIMLQSSFFLKKDLGFNKNNLLAINLSGSLSRVANDTYKTFKSEFLSHSGITNATITSNIPGERLSVEAFIPKGREKDDDLPSVRVMRVDEDYLATMEMKVIDGQSFTERTILDSTCIINRTAAEAYGIDNIYGTIGYNPLRSRNFEAIGVVDDFNFASLHSQIEPLIIEYNPGWGNYLLVRYSPERLNDVLAFIKEKTYELAPDYLLNYQFIDSRIEQSYSNELNMNRIFKAFTIFTILISCLGLFGLSAFSAKLKTKEIGIRKVLGASMREVNYNYMKDFSILIIIASIISVPIAWIIMDKWLQTFTYRIDLAWWMALAVIFLALIITLVTLSYHSFRLSRLNPVDVIRYE